MTTAAARDRIHIFVDLSNLEITMDKQLGARFYFDWTILPGWLARQAAEVGQLPGAYYVGTHVYASYDPAQPRAGSYRRWLTTFLDRQPGVQVVVKERTRRLDPPRCTQCHTDIERCPACGQDPRGMQEKGIDTAIVTDMIGLAWEDAYDVAVLVSSDSDFIPAVEHLSRRGLRVIQAGFKNTGNALAAPCWASFDTLLDRRNEFERLS